MKTLTPVKERRRLRKLADAAINKMEKVILSELLDTAEPDYSLNSLPPLEIKKTHFEYNKPDLSRLIECKTEDEIIESILFPEKNNHRYVSIDEYANCGPEVKEYWLQKIKQSEVKRGRAYKKIE